MCNPYRLDAVVLGVDVGHTVLKVYAPRELRQVRSLTNCAIPTADAWMKQNGWELIDPNSQYAHAVQGDHRWQFLEKHFYVPCVALVVCVKARFALLSPTNNRYLSEEGTFTKSSSSRTGTQFFDSTASARSHLFKLGLREVQ